jgi:hypothetical protein
MTVKYNQNKPCKNIHDEDFISQRGLFLTNFQFHPDAFCGVLPCLRHAGPRGPLWHQSTQV